MGKESPSNRVGTPADLLDYMTKVANLNQPVRLLACLQVQKQSESAELCQGAHFPT